MAKLTKDSGLMSGKGESGGKWVTVKGAHIYIEDGQSIEDAMKAKLEKPKQAVSRQSGQSSSTESASKPLKLSTVSAEQFYSAISQSKKLDSKNGWAVDIHSKEEYNEMRVMLAPNGKAGCAVEPNGNIVSVFNAKDSGYKGIVGDLLAEAVAQGGDRLDAYGKGLFKKYTEHGFEPVSWVEWNDEYAPDDWSEERGRHPVIFYKYTGHNDEFKYEDFLTRVKPSTDYDTAKSIRDKELKR